MYETPTIEYVTGAREEDISARGARRRVTSGVYVYGISRTKSKMEIKKPDNRAG